MAAASEEKKKRNEKKSNFLPGKISADFIEYDVDIFSGNYWCFPTSTIANTMKPNTIEGVGVGGGESR